MRHRIVARTQAFDRVVARTQAFDRIALWLALAAVTAAITASAVSAEDLRAVLAAPAGPVHAGQEAVLSLLMLNTGAQEARARLPATLSCRLSTAGTQRLVTARLQNPKAEETVVAGGAFAEGRYTLSIPAEIIGTVLLEADELSAGGIVLTVVEPGTPVRATAPATLFRPPREYRTFDELFSLYQPYLSNLAAYEPMYMLAGTDLEDSKLQLSFRYRFFNPDGPFVEKHPWTQGLNFGYTQTSFWDLEASSKPFDDTSYKPGLFYISNNLGWRPSWATAMFVQTGYQHESNGRGGPESRSADYFYLRPIFILYGPGSRYGLMIAPKVWGYLNTSDENADLADYRGYFDLSLVLGKADSWVLSSNLRWARKGASMQLDFTFPLHRLPFQNTNLYFHVQYANALAESMIDYRERTEALRLGFSVVR